jgi:hypothetical protein
MNSPNLSASNRSIIDQLQRSDSNIDIRQGSPDARPGIDIGGRTSGFEDGFGSDIELWVTGNCQRNQSILLHELVHASQNLNGSPINEQDAYDTGSIFDGN